jgi:hypothetical protein
MPEARNHHFISQCYLKGFTEGGSKDSQLFAINLTDGSTFSTRPRNVGAKRDFNRVEGRPPGELDQALSSFECEVDLALDRIRRLRRIDSPADWNAVLNLIALFAVRHPRLREAERKFIEATLRMKLSASLSTPERWESLVRQMRAAGAFDEEPDVSYEQVKSFHEEAEYDIGIPNAWHINLEIDSHDTVLETMAARKWRLCLADAASGGLVTSDQPVCLMHSDGDMASFQKPVGYGTFGSTVVFPLGRELLAVGTFEDSGGATQLSPFQVAYMNGIICSFAWRQVYSSDANFKVVIAKQLEPITGAELSRELAERHKSSEP